MRPKPNRSGLGENGLSLDGGPSDCSNAGRTAAAAVAGVRGSRNLSQHQGATALIKNKRKNSAEKCGACEGFKVRR